MRSLSDIAQVVDLLEGARRLVAQAQDAADDCETKAALVQAVSDHGLASIPSQMLLTLRTEQRVVCTMAALANRSVVDADKHITKATESLSESSVAAQLEESAFMDVAEADLVDALGKAHARIQEARRFASTALKLQETLSVPVLALK